LRVLGIAVVLGISGKGQSCEIRRPDYRADLDELADSLRREGMSYQEIAKRLGINPTMADLRVKRHERLLREGANPQRQ